MGRNTPSAKVGRRTINPHISQPRDISALLTTAIELTGISFEDERRAELLSDALTPEGRLAYRAYKQALQSKLTPGTYQVTGRVSDGSVEFRHYRR